jgi:hypothetical protein
MGREVRRVKAGWRHPKEDGNFKPLFEGYAAAKAEFEEMQAKDGLQEAIEYMGCPDKSDYMPDWTDEEKTHIQMYENTSEGTPISPVMDTPENLAGWLTDNGASAFASMTADYESWLRVCTGGFAPSAVIVGGKMESGVAGL